MAATTAVGVRSRSPFAKISIAHLAIAGSALVGGGLTIRLLASADARVEVAVLAEALPAGSALPDRAIRWEPIRIDDSAADAVVTRSELASLRMKVTAQPLVSGTFLSGHHFVPVTSGGGTLAEMSIAVDRSRAVGGALVAGDRIDVLAAETVDGSGRVADDLEVVAVDRGDDGPLGGSLDKMIVTLSVTRTQAVSLAAAVRAGEIDLIKTTGLGPASDLPSKPVTEGEAPS